MKLVNLIVALTVMSSPLLADDFSAVEEQIRAAMAEESRPEADVARDRNRMPVETLKFFGLRDDMKIIELMPGGGWYTRILAPVMKDRGAYYAALGTDRIKDRLAGQPGFENMRIVAEDSRVYRPEGSRHYALETAGLGVTDADMVLTFRNYHNFGPEGRAALNRVVFDALKPGGVYAVVDHSRRHMQPDDGENRRRMDPVLVIREVQAAGFVFEDFADLHYRPDDELRYEVGRRTVTGNTDRFTFRFRKPE
jgi:predicted methyltransferase